MSGTPKVHVDCDPDAIAKLVEAMRSDSCRPRLIHANRRAAVAWQTRCTWLKVYNQIALALLRVRYPRSRHAAALLVSAAATAIGLVSLLVAYLTDVRAIATVGGLVTIAGGLAYGAIVCWSPREW